MANLAPPSIASVLAANTSASKSTSTASSGSGSSSSTAATNQAQLLANQKAAAEREAARKAASGVAGTRISAEIVPEAPTYSFIGGATPEQIAAANAETQRYNATYGGRTPGLYSSTTKNGVTTTRSPGQTSTSTSPMNVSRTPAVSQKVQVGKLISDFSIGLGSSGGDKTKYRNNINYDALSPNGKVVADKYFDAQNKKKDEDILTTPTVTPTTNRAGLKTVVPTTQDNSVAGIRAANPGMSIADARAESLRRRTAAVITSDTPVTANPDTDYITETKTVIDTIKEQADKDRADQIAAAEENKRVAEEYNNSLIADNQNALTTFEAEQNALLKSYEGNRLNQVQGDLRRILLERGVDVSKVTPEQLIALSGTVGVNAFKDVSAAKEKATAAIETARQNALAKISQLKSNNVLNQTQYNSALADINSKTESQKNNLDLKLAELKFGVLTNAATTAKTDAQAVAQNVLSTAQALGVTGTQMGLVQSFIQNAKSTPEAISKLLAELQNPNSPLYVAIKSKEDAATKQAVFANALKQYEAETDRLKAQASVTSANRPRSSGAATVVYGNPTIAQQ